MVEKVELCIPTINLNGTRADSLIHDNLNAVEAIRLAIRMLENATPNGRDFPGRADILHSELFRKALAAHGVRHAKLSAVLSELEAIVEGIVEQKDKRETIKRSYAS